MECCVSPITKSRTNSVPTNIYPMTAYCRLPYNCRMPKLRKGKSPKHRDQGETQIVRFAVAAQQCQQPAVGEVAQTLAVFLV